MYSLCKVKTSGVFHISVPVLAPKHHKAFNYQVHTDLYFYIFNSKGFGANSIMCIF